MSRNASSNGTESVVYVILVAIAVSIFLGLFAPKPSEPTKEGDCTITERFRTDSGIILYGEELYQGSVRKVRATFTLDGEGTLSSADYNGSAFIVQDADTFDFRIQYGDKEKICVY